MYDLIFHAVIVVAFMVLASVSLRMQRHYLVGVKLTDKKFASLRAYADYLCAWCRESSHNIIGGPVPPMDYAAWVATPYEQIPPPPAPPASQDTGVEIHEDGPMPTINDQDK